MKSKSSPPSNPIARRDTTHLTTQDLARRWSFSEATLRNWRWAGKGPPALKLGSRVVYRLTDVEAFEAQHVPGDNYGCRSSDN